MEINLDKVNDLSTIRIPGVMAEISRAYPNDPNVTEKIIELSSSYYPSVRGKMAKLLGKREGKEAGQHLIKMLDDRDVEVRASVVEILGTLRYAEAIPQLADKLNDADKDVRKTAVWALGEMEGFSTVPHILDGLENDKWETRMEARKALGRMIENCESREELAEVEGKINERSEVLFRKNEGKRVLDLNTCEAQAAITGLQRASENKRKKLPKDVLLTDKPKSRGGKRSSKPPLRCGVQF